MQSYVASRVAAKQAEGMLAPLLESDDDCERDRDSDLDSSASSEVETAKQSPMQVMKSLIVYLVLGAGLAASAAAMVISPSLISFIMGGVCIATVPTSVIKERQLGKLPTLRSMNNKMREEANNLTEQVDVLSQEIDMLKPEADRAAAVEEQLRAIADKQLFNVNRLVELVKENESILAQMKVNLRQRICQDIIHIVMKSDKNNDQTISKGEANLLALRIRLQLYEYGVEFDSDKFLRVIATTSSVAGVIDIVQKLLQPKEEREDNEDDSDYDMFSVVKNDLTSVAAGAKGSGSGARVSLMK